MIPRKMSEAMAAEVPHEHDGDSCCDHGGHDHSHAHVPMKVVFFGGALLVSSYIADMNWLYGEKSFQGEVLAVFATILLGLPIIISAVKDILSGRYFMNELVALGLLAAIIGEDFRTAAAVAFFMLIAIAIEHNTAIGARHAIEKLIRLTPRRANKLDAQGNESEVEATELSPNDIIIVRPGDLFPVDGAIISGNTSVNQASITGESLPVDLGEKDPVYAGTENLSGAVRVSVTVTGANTTLGKVRQLIEQAENTRLPVMRLIDRYTAWYIPMVLMLAAAVYFFSGFDLSRVVAVLVIACPCALVVATPSALVAAVASSARLGLLVKDVSVMEQAANVQDFVFDKTGTLTLGELSVSQLLPVEGVSQAELLLAAALCEQHSTHPVARAIVSLSEKAGVALAEPDKSTEVPGRGVRSELEGKTFRVGRRTWLEQERIAIDESQLPDANAGKSMVFIARDGQFLGTVTLSDTLRPEAAEALQQLRSLGSRSLNMVSGDNASAAENVASQLSLDSVRSECLPQHKVEFVEELKKTGAVVAVVGDGVNDAPALAAGQVSLAMGVRGSDIAVSSASVALMNNDLRRIPFFFRLCRLTGSVMRQNIGLGVISIVAGLILTSVGLMSGVTAALYHTIATLLIVGNSARLVRQGEELENNE